MGGSSPKVAEVTCCDGREATGTAVVHIHGPLAVEKVPKDVKAFPAMSINHEVATEAVSCMGHTEEEDAEISNERCKDFVYRELGKQESTRKNANTDKRVTWTDLAWTASPLPRT